MQKLIISLLLLVGSWGGVQISQNMEETKKAGAYELVVFKFKSEVSGEEAVKAAASVDEFIQSQKGFISRRTAKTADGIWMDFLEWETMTDAQVANEAAMQSPVAGAFFAQLEEVGMQFYHLEPVFD